MKTDHVRSGGAATAPTETPVKAGTTEKDYIFSGWNKAFDSVTETSKFIRNSPRPRNSTISRS